MRTPSDAILLRIFVAEDDTCEHRPLYEAIVERAFAMKLAGATVLPGPEGFGQSGVIRSEVSIDAGPRRPMVVEIVDAAAQIERFLPVLDDMMGSGLVTLERVRAIAYPRREPSTSRVDA
jgi:PII-like signaling protein